MSFNRWLDTFVDEKGLDRNRYFEKIGPSGLENSIPLEVVLEHIKIAPPQEKEEIKKMLVKIDFKNADAMGYFEHLAGAIAK